jgi:hypothetical protein
MIFRHNAHQIFIRTNSTIAKKRLYQGDTGAFAAE